ncbi:type II toxin-antitoxin system HipA family toxin [Orrella sp. 11846]|uniref:type II toxin-antitoxin system HipA family toxin n=1 Tax=Orrella sp. 11846 TaxID=3409913 RepID=UPI003B5972F4
MSRQALVYADWMELHGPQLVGTLRSTQIRNHEHFSFNYDADWLQLPQVLQVDPELQLYSGEQHSQNNKNFRAFLDSCPDRWGRMLMRRREALQAASEGRRARSLHEIDYLLGVHDFYRQGALRFKATPEGAFLDDDERLAAPPLAQLKELEHAAWQVETQNTSDPDYAKWLYMLMSPGSSLGGARPKASVVDVHGSLWIAKFPSRYDEYDLAAWEFVVYRLAIAAGIQMSSCRIQKFNSAWHTFLTQRFDRLPSGRLHFTSAMTQLGYYDGDYEASYLELVQFLTEYGSRVTQDLAQLWRRIVFNIAVSNTDDHLRNHGFIFSEGGWQLSPAYDINPTLHAQGLHLNIDTTDNRLDFDLALSVIDYFQLSKKDAEDILQQVCKSVRNWRTEANAIGIHRAEQDLMADAFRY